MLILLKGSSACLYSVAWFHSRCALSLQNVYYTSTQQLFVGILSPTIDDDDNKCLVDVNGRPRLIECSYAAAKRMKLHWRFTQVIQTGSHPWGVYTQKLYYIFISSENSNLLLIYHMTDKSGTGQTVNYIAVCHFICQAHTYKQKTPLIKLVGSDSFHNTRCNLDNCM